MNEVLVTLSTFIVKPEMFRLMLLSVTVQIPLPLLTHVPEPEAPLLALQESVAPETGTSLLSSIKKVTVAFHLPPLRGVVVASISPTCMVPDGAGVLVGTGVGSLVGVGSVVGPGDRVSRAGGIYRRLSGVRPAGHAEPKLWRVPV